MTDVVRTARDDDERAALAAVLVESFGNEELPWARWMDRIGHENVRVLAHDGAIRGGLGFYPMGQHWGGARVAAIGLAGVGIAPAYRGRGLARTLVAETLADARARHVPLALLYASSTTVYRSAGFEQAGTSIRYAAPTATLGRGDAALECAPFDPASDEAMAPLRALYEARAQRWNGHLDRNEAIWARITRPYVGTSRGYRFGPADRPEGYVVYQHAPRPEGLEFTIALRDLVLDTPAAARRCATLLSDLRSLGSEVRWLGCAADPLVSLLPEQTARVLESHRWMLRLVDTEAALRERGYACEGQARFGVRDPLFGDLGLRLAVRDGRPELAREPFDRMPTILHVRGLAALYTGFAHPVTLRAMGLLEGDLEPALSLARLFAGPEPWLCDWF
jgi:predicted acetyltransferase